MSLPTPPAARISAPPNVAALKDAAQAARLHKSSRQFEAVFVEQMLQQMRKTTLSSGLFSGGVEKDIYNSFMDQAVADKVASRGGFGLGAMVERTLSARQKPPAGHGGARPGTAIPLHSAPATPVPLAPLTGAGPAGPMPAAAPVTVAPAPGLPGEVVPGALPATDSNPAAQFDGSLAARIELGAESNAPMEPNGFQIGAAGSAPADSPTASGAIAEVPARMAVLPDPGPIGFTAGPAPNPDRTADRNPARGPAAIGPPHRLDPAILSASREFGVDARLLKAVLLTESGGRSGAVSPSGAVGLMQLMPDTARAMGVRNVFDPMENLRGGARYLSQLLHRFGGSITHALAAYNAGPGTVVRHGGVPPYPETRQYVARVLRERRRLAAA